MSDEMTGLTIAEAGELIRGRRLSPVELTEAVLERIERLDGEINAYITVTADEARESARAAADEIAAATIAGRCTASRSASRTFMTRRACPRPLDSKFLKENVADEDAPSVARLRQAGAIFTGKLNLHEFAFGADTVNPFYGACHNPWNLDHIAGGSSGGSGAAVAAGLASAPPAATPAGRSESPPPSAVSPASRRLAAWSARAGWRH